jgi:hypothetical protein
MCRILQQRARGIKEGRKDFFFEKKKQKTFANSGRSLAPLPVLDSGRLEQKFFASFFQKRSPSFHYGVKKLCAKLPATIRHPSTITKKINLNGSEILLGGSIIMPKDISTLATTRSMMVNGK